MGLVVQKNDGLVHYIILHPETHRTYRIGLTSKSTHVTFIHSFIDLQEPNREGIPSKTNAKVEGARAIHSVKGDDLVQVAKMASLGQFFDGS